jgi:hypothetical protein
MKFDDAFARAYELGLRRRWEKEREERERAQREQMGKALQSMYPEMVLSPYQERADAFARDAAAVIDANSSTLAEALLGGTEAPEAQAAMQRLGGMLEVGRQPIVAALDSARQRATSVQKLPGEVFMQMFPYLLQVEQQKEARFKDAQQRAAMEAYRASLSSEQRKIFDASTYAKPDVLKLMFPQDSYGGTGGVIYNKNTGKTVYEKPAAINYHYTTDDDGNVWQINPQTGEKRNLGPIGKSLAGGYDKVQIAQANRDIAAHNKAYQAALKLDPDADETKLPTYEAAQRAQAYLSGAMPYQAGDRQPAGEGMSPVIKRFAEELNYDIETKGPDFARQWIKANADALRQRGIDPDIALTWIP